jgi:DNA-binding CsgD family transcriptional regulator/tetratricopeptide (TPR) repeat protein
VADAHPLVGRDPEKSRLADRLRPGAREEPGVIFIAGEAGIGKSRLVAEALSEVSRPVLRGSSTADSATPYAPIVQIIRAYARQDRDALLALPLTEHLSLLLLELGPPRSETDPQTLRAAICDVAALSGESGSIWVLEDLHWADAGTLDVLVELAEVPAGSGLSVVATYRNDELPRLHRLRSVRSELRRTGRLHEIVLQPITREESDLLAEDVAGTSLPPDVRQAIFERSDGIPFFVVEMAASTALTAGTHGSDPREDELPETLRDSIRLRTSVIDTQEVDVLEVMAAGGINIDLPLLADLTDPDAATRLIERGWLIGINDGTASFRHALVRDAIYADIPWLRRRERHRLLAEALEARDAPPEEVAHHWLAARETLRARAHLLRAARSFCSIHAYRDARALLDQTLQEWGADADDPERIAALELLARCAELSGDHDEAVGLWREISLDRERREDAEGLARAQRRLATLLELRGDWDEAIAARIAAADNFGACAQPAEAASQRLAAASHLQSGRDLDTALELVERARSEAEVADQADLKLRVLAMEGQIRAKLGEPNGVTMSRNALDLALSADNTGLIADAYYRLAAALEHTAAYAEAIDVYQTAFAFCKSRGVEGMGEICLACLTPTARHVGRWKEASDVCRQIMGDPQSDPFARNVAAGELGLINALKGNVTSARRLLPSALSFARLNGIFELVVECCWGLAMVQALEGKPEESSATASQLIEACAQRDEWHYSLSAMRWCSTWFAARGNERALLSAVEVLSNATARMGSPEARAALGHGLIELALLNRDEEHALIQADATLKLLDEIAAPYEVAEIRACCGMALVAGGRRDAAIGALTASYRTAKKLGARPLADNIIRRFKALGEPIEPHLGRGADDRAERGGLSRRELDVLRHVARGKTNKEVADSLFLSTRTVDMHVRNILLKLDCRSRADAVRRAGELRLLGDADPANTA